MLPLTCNGTDLNGWLSEIGVPNLTAGTSCVVVGEDFGNNSCSLSVRLGPPAPSCGSGDASAPSSRFVNVVVSASSRGAPPRDRLRHVVMSARTCSYRAPTPMLTALLLSTLTQTTAARQPGLMQQLVDAFGQEVLTAYKEETGLEVAVTTRASPVTEAQRALVLRELSVRLVTKSAPAVLRAAALTQPAPAKSKLDALAAKLSRHVVTDAKTLGDAYWSSGLREAAEVPFAVGETFGHIASTAAMLWDAPEKRKARALEVGGDPAASEKANARELGRWLGKWNANATRLQAATIDVAR
ncbi:MAG: hypothetical protein JNK82_12055 [Myxococcaceae bacterium]|nr:hypothetical protein [Myxococcaceae bacterium]